MCSYSHYGEVISVTIQPIYCNDDRSYLVIIIYHPLPPTPRHESFGIVAASNDKVVVRDMPGIKRELLNPLSPPLVATLMATQYSWFGCSPVMIAVL